MPWQLQIKRKDGSTILADLGFAKGWTQRPNINDEFTYPIESIKVRVTSIQPTEVGAGIGQPLEIVHAEEI
jgi:hypothetical protein